MRLATVALLLFLGVAFGKRCNDGKIRGVNLGGWLVLEEWMTPSLFEDFQSSYGDHIHDEWTLAESVPEEVYKERLVHHWDTFFSKAVYCTNMLRLIFSIRTYSDPIRIGDS